MKITEKLAAKSLDNLNNDGVTIAFLGDSVTQGCFELYMRQDGVMETVFDSEHAYHRYLQKIFSVLYPSVPVNIINAGISGTTARMGLNRLERDVISHRPDMVVVCFGLNDCGSETIEDYTSSLEKIFKTLNNKGIECIFMTPNMMSSEVNPYTLNEAFHGAAKENAKLQKSGKLDFYIDAAKTVCGNSGIKVCDCYARWKAMADAGVNVRDMLANQINHPTRSMNWLFAVSLAECIFDII